MERLRPDAALWSLTIPTASMAEHAVTGGHCRGLPDQPRDQYLDIGASVGTWRRPRVIAGLHAVPTAFEAERGIASMMG